MDPATATRERTLWTAALAGDEPAWAELYSAAYDTVFRYALWRCGSRTDLAEDVVQEAWLLAARRLKAFDPDRGQFAGWVCGLAANVARNAVRTRLRAARRLLTVPAPDSEPDRDQDPEAVALALAQLPADYEAVLRAKYFDQRSVTEIARQLGKSAKAVESLLTRAREAFKAAYRTLGGTDRE
jgi:RNA polymerase sigma-70 factor (ECF subfamily)